MKISPFLALKEVSVDIEAGEFISVVGPSGCGKSTLMLMVAGLLKRSRGDIVVAGKIVTKPITDVGIAFQDHLLLEFRKAIANVMLQAEIRGLPRSRSRRRAKELFAAASPDARDEQISPSAFWRYAPACFARSAPWSTTRRCC